MEDFLLPPRMFTAGEEPLGERVNSYHKIKRTELLIDALEPEELLKVNKKYEVWFIFSGIPVRMSLREFAIVTGLNCQKIPEPTKKRKNPLKEKLYWNELLVSLKLCTVDTTNDMLKKKVVKSKEARIKFAYLAITSSILFPSSHTPHIIPEHLELIRDLDEFLAFPWGRASYHTLATSLISKDEIALSQASVAIRDYSENPNEEITSEDDTVLPHDKPSEATKYCVILGLAKSIDIECQVPVKSILDEPYEEWSAGLDFLWVDESEDLAVENMRGVKKLKEKEPKEKNDKDHAAEVTDGEGSDSQAHILIAILVASQLVDKSRSSASYLRDEISSLEKPILQTTIARCLQDIDKKIGAALVDQLKIMQAAILKGVTELIDQTSSSRDVAVEHMIFGKSSEFLPQQDTTAPHVNGNTPVVPDISTPSEAADFRISEVLCDLNIVPDHSLPANTDVDDPRKTLERGGTDADDNHDAELDTVNESSIQISMAADSQLQVEQREVQVEELVAANNITEQTEHILDDNKTPNLENNQSLGVSTMVVEKPVSQEFEMEEEDASVVEETPNPINYVSPPKAHEEEVPELHKSKRSRIIPAGLQDYKCDPKVKAGLCIIPDVDQRFTLMEQKVMKES
ncbi:hypothetical protein F2Q69_00039999 [Brassica cretica]|uniref:DUF1985 domain-containing protein n=1 Tax=Brassica cretica TaxID=69181 RepID=A0A8S9NKE6_BRACR|nr:hypothetical protein F2Q69_00039999 [Brassica cretica]